nr:MAG TPA: hypothetical protein [Caudoviricetes sp.]
MFNTISITSYSKKYSMLVSRLFIWYNFLIK